MLPKASGHINKVHSSVVVLLCSTAANLRLLGLLQGTGMTKVEHVKDACTARTVINISGQADEYAGVPVLGDDHLGTNHQHRP
jgi:hypothetical protein